MGKKKPPQLAGKSELSIVRSSAAEYLTFVAASGQGGVEAVYADGNVWISQKMMGLLYDVETHTINYHLKKVFDDSELEADSVIRNFRITAADGKSYHTRHYNLAAIIAVGYKVNSVRAVQFRKWATTVIESFTLRTACSRAILTGRSSGSKPGFKQRALKTSPRINQPSRRRRGESQRVADGQNVARCALVKFVHALALLRRSIKVAGSAGEV